MTILFPDSSASPTNGMFKTQEEFRKFVLENQNGRWNSVLHCRSKTNRVKDYNRDTLGDAFPLIFPFGYTGLDGDPEFGLE